MISLPGIHDGRCIDLTHLFPGNELMTYQPTDTADLGDLFDLPDMNTSLSDNPLYLDTADLNTPVLSPSASKQITTEEVD